MPLVELTQMLVQWPTKTRHFLLCWSIPCEAERWLPKVRWCHDQLIIPDPYLLGEWPDLLQPHFMESGHRLGKRLGPTYRHQCRKERQQGRRIGLETI